MLRLVLSITILILISCSNDRSLTPNVPDFQLNEVRKYNSLTRYNTELNKDPKLLPLSAVDGMYCFPKEEIALLIKDWKERNKKNEWFDYKN